MLDNLFNIIETLAQESLKDPLQAFPIYFLAGLASSLLPCVYPLIPVTVGFLQKRNPEGHVSDWHHPLYYWLGTILSYTMLGLVAALGGGAFNKLMQNGFVIILTGMLFVFLAFVMIDWYHLSFMGANKIVDKAAKKSGAGYTILMGFGAGFIASACVAPALVAMLIFIAKTTSGGGNAAVNIIYGSALSSAFGAGLGIPFFLAGVLHAKLPKSGNWMIWIKWGFTALIMSAGFYQISKGFSTLGYSEMDITIILTGLGLLGFAAFLGLKPPEESDRMALTKFIFALVFFAFGISAVVRGINPGLTQLTSNTPDISNPQTSAVLTKNTDHFEMLGNLKFFRDKDYAYNLAAAEKKPIFLDFYADWCANCKDFYVLAQENKELNQALGKAVLLKIKDTDAIFLDYSNKEQFRELQIGLPFFAVIAPNGKDLIFKTTNYKNTKGMVEAIHSALSVSP